MTRYVVQEIPNTDSPDVHEFCHCIELNRNEATPLLSSVLQQNLPNARIAPPLVAIAMLQRINEVAASAQILMLKKRERDAAILILSAYELQLDAMYIAADSSRANTWLDHAREHKKPWSVSELQKKLFTDQGELVAEQDIYRHYSMIKHCNPSGGAIAFPIAVRRGHITLTNARTPQLAAVYLFGLGVALLRTITAAATLTNLEGFDVSATLQRISVLRHQLDTILEKYLIRCLQTSATEDPVA